MSVLAQRKYSLLSLSFSFAALSLSACAHSLPKEKSEPVAAAPKEQKTLGLREPASGLLPSADYRRLRGFYDHGLLAAEGESPVAITLVQEARRTLDIEIYEMKDPDFLQAVSQAVDRGVKVRVIKDPQSIGDTCKLFAADSPNAPEESPNGDTADTDSPEDSAEMGNPCDQLKALKQKVLAAGGEFKPFNRPTLCHRDDAVKKGKRCYQHGKLLLADAKTFFPRALLSTGNFNSSSFCNLKYNPSKCNRDFSFVTRNKKEIRQLLTIFENDLKTERYPLPDVLQAGPSSITVSPYSAEPLVRFIQSAQGRIQITNQYLKEEKLNQALIAAAKRGVQVEATVGSFCSFARPTPKAQQKARDLMQPLTDAGVKVSYFTKQVQVAGKPGYLHAKAIVVDNSKAWIGSVNGSDESVNKNREFGIFFSNPKWVAPLAEILAADHRDPGVATLDESLNCTKDRN